MAATSVCVPGWGPGGSLRSAGGSDPGSFQITASATASRVCEILCVHFKTGVSISHSALAVPKVSPTGLQSQTFWGLMFLMQNCWAGEPDVRLRSLAPWGEPCNCNYPPICGSPSPGDMGLDSTMTPHLLPVSLWFLLYIFSCRSNRQPLNNYYKYVKEIRGKDWLKG